MAQGEADTILHIETELPPPDPPESAIEQPASPPTAASEERRSNNVANTLRSTEEGVSIKSKLLYVRRYGVIEAHVASLRSRKGDMGQSSQSRARALRLHLRLLFFFNELHFGISSTWDHQVRWVRQWIADKFASKIWPVDQYPEGYGKLAAFIDCDPNFRIYRKFGWLHNRVLLHIQDELQKLEKELEVADEWEAKSGDIVKLASRRLDTNKARKDVIIAIKDKLDEYGENRPWKPWHDRRWFFPDKYLLRLHKLEAIRTPTKRNQNSVYNMIYNTQSLVASEARWIRQREDLAAVGHGAEHGWFNGFVEDLLNKVSAKLLLVSSVTKNIDGCKSILPLQLWGRIVGHTCAMCSQSVVPKNSLSSFRALIISAGLLKT